MPTKRIALTTALLTAALLCGPAWAQKLRVAFADVEVAPYQLGNGSEIPNPPGTMIELLNQAAKELGIEIVYERAPQLRSLKRLQLGELDGAFMYSYTPERLAYGRYPMKDGKPDDTARLANQSYVFYRLKGSPFSWDGHTVSGLGNGAVGFNSTFSVGAVLAKQNIKAQDAKTTEQNFSKLRLGRIAAFAMLEQAGDRYLASHPLPNVEKLSIPFETKAYYLMLSHQLLERDPALAEKIWTKLAKLRSEVMPDEPPKPPKPQSPTRKKSRGGLQ